MWERHVYGHIGSVSPERSLTGPIHVPPASRRSTQGKRSNYIYKLKQKVGAYPQGLVSTTGYYKLAVAGGQYTTFTYWWQARLPAAASGLRGGHFTRFELPAHCGRGDVSAMSLAVASHR